MSRLPRRENGMKTEQDAASVVSTPSIIATIAKANKTPVKAKKTTSGKLL